MDGIWIILLIALAILGAPLFSIFGAAAMLLFGALPDTSITAPPTTSSVRSSPTPRCS